MRLHYLPLAVITLALAGCMTRPAEPRVAVVENQLPIGKQCKPTPVRPKFPDTAEALKAASDDRYVQILQAGRELRIPYIAELENLLTGCGGTITEP